MRTEVVVIRDTRARACRRGVVVACAARLIGSQDLAVTQTANNRAGSVLLLQIGRAFSHVVSRMLMVAVNPDTYRWGSSSPGS